MKRRQHSVPFFPHEMWAAPARRRSCLTRHCSALPEKQRDRSRLAVHREPSTVHREPSMSR
ncbi:MAG: hypothetical protein LBF05_02725 [Tannerella sp.]|nr:hypothetical protein [Tannerella sp.]